MKRSGNSNHPNFKTKNRFLRIGLLWGLVMLLGVVNYGCEKEEEDVYYVRYFIDSSSIDSGGQLNVTFRTEKNEDLWFVIDQNTKWEATIGPVSKGFNAKISISNKAGSEKLHVYTEIDVSKNNSPFVFKAKFGPPSEGIYVVSTFLGYTIDY